MRRLTASSSASRNRERSFFENDGPPPEISPISRSSRDKSRMARPIPILSSVNGFPVAPITCAPASRHRLASGISLVIAISDPANMLGYPIVSCIRPIIDNHPPYIEPHRQPHGCIGDKNHRQAMPVRDFDDFHFYRASICIDINLRLFHERRTG